MKNILICVAFCVFSASLGFAEAEVSQQEKSVLSLTVEDAVSYALKNSKSLKSSAIDLEIAKRASDNSWNTFLPSLSASATAARQNNIESTVDSANSAAYSALKLRELDVRVVPVAQSGKDFIESVLNPDYRYGKSNGNFVYIQAYDREEEE